MRAMASCLNGFFWCGNFISNFLSLLRVRRFVSEMTPMNKLFSTLYLNTYPTEYLISMQVYRLTYILNVHINNEQCSLSAFFMSQVSNKIVVVYYFILSYHL